MVALRVYARQARRLVLIAALVSAPSFLIAVWAGAAGPAGNPLATAAAGLLAAVLNVVGLGAVTLVADSQDLPVAPALAGGLRRFWPLLGAGLLTAIAVTVGLICLVVPGVYLAVALSLVTPAVVLGGAGVGAAMRTSYRLTTRGTFWRAGETLLIGAVMTTVVAYALGVAPTVTSLLAAVRATGAVAPTPWWQQILSYVGKVVTMPFGTIVAVVLYRDLETRKADPAR